MGGGSEPSVTAHRQLVDRVALITGAASDRGRAAAQLMAEQGAAVVAVDIDDDGAHETVERIEKDGGRATALHADVSARHNCDAMVATTIETYARLDVLANFAATGMPSRLVDTTEDAWDATIAINLSAVFWTCRAAIPQMLNGQGGIIVNACSTLGWPEAPDHVAAGAARAGLIALTRRISAEYAPRVRANVIAPDTNGWGAPDAVARLALLLVGDASAHPSGAVIPCDRRAEPR
jgi:NAD(P)-dependent dehydrogenase (short-subunit alcohol dehydrogenase family)